MKIDIASSRHSNKLVVQSKESKEKQKELGRVAWEPSSPIFIFSSPFTLNCSLRYSVYGINLHSILIEI